MCLVANIRFRIVSIVRTVLRTLSQLSLESSQYFTEHTCDITQSNREMSLVAVCFDNSSIVQKFFKIANREPMQTQLGLEYCVTSVHYVSLLPVLRFFFWSLEIIVRDVWI